MTRRDVASHLFSCCDAVYRSLGESAPLLEDDAYVVRVHEMSRAFGALALAWREELGGASVEPLAQIESTIRASVAPDPSGALCLYAMSMVIGPRLLVSFRDARHWLGDDETLFALIDLSARVTVGELHRVANVVHEQADVDDPRWRHAARALVEELDASGNVDSFGISR